jgi:hypothetical protein
MIGESPDDVETEKPLREMLPVVRAAGAVRGDNPIPLPAVGGIYPGGLVTFGPSYIAAGKIADDLGVQKWWSEPPSVVEARKSKML